jgi:hypothetical protein
MSGRTEGSIDPDRVFRGNRFCGVRVTRLSLALVVTLLSAGCGDDDSYTGAGGGTGGGDGGTGPDFDAGACVDTWANFGATFFSDSCASCHGASGSHASVTGAANTLAWVISSETMPPGGGVSSSERARAVLYLRCGAP